jgi:hypothetical protein
VATRDDSAYILLHADINDHPKIEPLSDAGFRLFVSLLGYCHRHRTNGYVPNSRWMKGKPRARAELLKMFPPNKNPLAYDHGEQVEIHDYLDWQQSSAEIAAAQARAAAGGSLGNHRRWHTQRGITDLGCSYCLSESDRSTDRRTDRGTDVAH